jgi:hypothetical protein
MNIVQRWNFRRDHEVAPSWPEPARDTAISLWRNVYCVQYMLIKIPIPFPSWPEPTRAGSSRLLLLIVPSKIPPQLGTLNTGTYLL